MHGGITEALCTSVPASVLLCGYLPGHGFRRCQGAGGSVRISGRARTLAPLETRPEVAFHHMRPEVAFHHMRPEVAFLDAPSASVDDSHF